MTIKCRKCDKTIEVCEEHSYYLVSPYHIRVYGNDGIDEQAMSVKCGIILICPVCSELNWVKEIPSQRQLKKDVLALFRGYK